MGRCRFVQPATERLPLSDGDWIEIKRELTIGDQKKLEAAGVHRVIGKDATVDWENYTIERVLVWVVKWSLVDAKGDQTKPDRETITALDVETFDEITDAIATYLNDQDAKKKATGAATLA